MNFNETVRYRLTFGRNISNPPASRTTNYVEDDEVKAFLKLVVGNRFEAFSVTHHSGFWNGEEESSFTVEILENIRADSLVAEIAEIYNSWFEQDCVLVTKETVAASFVSEKVEE